MDELLRIYRKVVVKNNSAEQTYRELGLKEISKEVSHWLEFLYSLQPMNNPFTFARVALVFKNFTICEVEKK